MAVGNGLEPGRFHNISAEKTRRRIRLLSAGVTRVYSVRRYKSRSARCAFSTSDGRRTMRPFSVSGEVAR